MPWFDAFGTRAAPEDDGSIPPDAVPTIERMLFARAERLFERAPERG
jgi:hypothetical protein